MRVLLSAYACAPAWGSEPEVGFRALAAAAREHEVWVLTQPSMAARVRAADELRGRDVHVVPVEPDSPGPAHGLRRLLDVHVSHDRWQRAAADVALRLEREVGFDLVHHVTLAAYWMRAGAASVRKPFLLGPVGGAVEPPLSLLPSLGIRGVAEAAVRTAVRRLVARSPSVREAQRRASVVLVQNQATARALRADDVRVLPNPLSIAVETGDGAAQRTGDVVVAGRLVPWKAVPLAVRSLALLTHGDARLHVVGDGPDRRRVDAAARRYAVQDRVVFHGRVPRSRAHAMIAGAGVLLHPSLHEEGGHVVAEALSLGTPVVALDRGGPRELVRCWPETPSRLVTPESPSRTAGALAVAVDDLLGAPAPVLAAARRPTRAFADELLAVYDEVAGTRDRTAP